MDYMIHDIWFFSSCKIRQISWNQHHGRIKAACPEAMAIPWSRRRRLTLVH